MGLYKTAIIKILKVISSENIIDKSLCMMGKQSIQIDLHTLKRVLEDLRIPYDRAIFKTMLTMENIDSYLLFKMIGIKEVHALDYSSFEGADLNCDLNKDIPDYLENKFDYIIDGGTLEHVYNVTKAMENMSKLLTPNGIIVHISPGGGLVNHGFYSFSPSFFIDYYNENHFHILDVELEFIMQYCEEEDYYGLNSVFSMDCRFFKEETDWERHNINRYILTMQKLKEIQHFYVWCIAKKLENTSIRVPIQREYQKLYNSLIAE